MIVEVPTAWDDDESAPNESRPKGKASQSDALVGLAQERYRFGISTEGIPFAVPHAGPHRAFPLRSATRGGFASALAHAFHRMYDKVPGSTAMADALRVLQFECETAGPEPLALRVGRIGNTSVLDLGHETSAAVVVGPDGWEFVDTPPVLFRRSRLTESLPAPTRDGDLNELRELLNLPDGAWDVFRAVLVAALLPGISHPVVALTGEAGSAKTTIMRLLTRVLDPGSGGNRAAPRSEDDWAVTASASYVLGIDNVSSITEWFSDALCRAVTGSAWSKRELYSDAEIVSLQVRRVMVLNGIGLGALRGDLADRLALVELDSIPPERRRTDETIDSMFAERHPAILGGLLDLTVSVLKRLPDVELPGLPRMADFARVAAAVDGVLASQALPIYLSQRETLDEAVLDADAFAGVLRAWLDRLPHPHELSASQVLSLIGNDHPERDRHWPMTPHAVGIRLRRLAPSFRRLGYGFEEHRPTTRSHQRRTTWFLAGRAGIESEGQS